LFRKLWAHLMEKKESPKREADSKLKPSGISSRLAGLSNKAFGIIKLGLGICLLPFVYSTSLVFLNQFSLIEKSLQGYFYSGAIALLIVYLFVWEPQIIYTKGQRLLEMIFVFFKPLVRLAPYVLPIYTIILFIIYGLLSLTIRSAWLIKYSIFLIGFTFALHLVFSARSIRSKKSDPLKADYIFGFSLIYIIDLAILAFCINLVFKEFSFVSFCNSAFQIAGNIFYAVFKQLFLR
jgi:hypothetical protein